MTNADRRTASLLSRSCHPTMADHLSTMSTITTLVLLWCTASLGASTERCRPKHYSHKAVQTDLSGRRCWDSIKVQSCGGYCLSYEVSHWQFPYKESHHPVCVHDERKHNSTKLRFCDPGVEPGTEVYHYVEAASCKCQICSSEDTSCEWLPPDSSLLGELILKEEILEEEIDQIPFP